MKRQYDRALIANIFDEYGEQEWERYERSPAARVAFHIHRHYLGEFVSRGDRVLEVGAGPGRFTIELARLGAEVFVTDISLGQLELNSKHVGDAGLEELVVGRGLADVTDLAQFADASFDAVVCYGGPLSWALDRADEAMAEVLRVVKRGGRVFASVMSLYGSFRAFLPGVAEEIDRFGLEEMREIFETGYQADEHSPLGPMHMFTWREVADLIGGKRCELESASASNFLSLQNDETTEAMSQSKELWNQLLSWELKVCREPGALDGGTHIIFIVRRI
jgi:SAM-dependent methyltransferase